MEEFVKGFLIGFVLCAPLGPIGIFCARRALVYGKLYGIVSILGASVADAAYCAITAFGIGHIADVLSNHRMTLRLIASIILIIVGLKIFVMKLRERDPSIRKGLFRAFFSTLLLTLSNPIPILVFGAAFAATGILSFDGGRLNTIMLVIGVFSGSAIWSPIMGSLLTIFTSQLDINKLLYVNRVAGLAIGGVGLVGVVTWFAKFLIGIAGS